MTPEGSLLTALAATFATALPVMFSPISVAAVRFVIVPLEKFVLVISVLFIVSPADKLGSLDALPVALVVLAIGLSLGGPTGYAINPARDLGPRIMHAILPIKNKGTSDWKHSWIPVFGPIIGGLIAAVLYRLIQ